MLCGYTPRVGPGVHEKQCFCLSIPDEDAPGTHAVVVCRIYERLISFPDFQVHGKRQPLARSPNVAW